MSSRKHAGGRPYLRPNSSPFLQKSLLVATAACALALAIYRASSQSITFDEAWSYQFYGKSLAGAMTFHTNNHVLNSLLMWMATGILGVSEFSVRLPALLGAGLYIAISYMLCRQIANNFVLRWALLVCLIFNPFVLDFMAAARGYSLANAFLLGAIAVPLLYRPDDRRSLPTNCMLASAALGLSFTANYSFAFVDATAFAAVLVWALWMRTTEPVSRIIATLVLPGLAVTLIVAGYPLLHWPVGQWKEDLWWGAHSLRETRDSLVQSSLFQPNPVFLGPLYKIATFLRRLTLLSLMVVCGARLIAMCADRDWLKPRGNCSTAAMLAIVGSTGLGSIGISWLLFHFRNLPLPLGRTGIYLVTLCTLFVGILAAAPARNLVSRWLGHLTTLVIVCLACYFVMCLRVSYFKEYQWNADIKQAYAVADQLSRSYGVTDVQTNSIDVSALNFYRELSPGTRLPEFRAETPEASPGRSLYIFHGDYWRDFIEKENLAVIYKGAFSELVVAVPRGGQIPSNWRLGVATGANVP